MQLHPSVACTDPPNGQAQAFTPVFSYLYGILPAAISVS